MTITIKKDHKFNSSETITINEFNKQKYLDKGFYCPADKMSFNSKEEENNAWMERFN